MMYAWTCDEENSHQNTSLLKGVVSCKCGIITETYIPDGKPWQRTATSLEWVHVVVFCTQPSWMVEEQSKSDISLPAQVRLLIQIGPVPEPNAPAIRDSVTIVFKIVLDVLHIPKLKAHFLHFLSIPHDSMPPVHLIDPNSCHTQSPTGFDCRLQHDLHYLGHQPPVECHLDCKLQNHWHC